MLFGSGSTICRKNWKGFMVPNAPILNLKHESGSSTPLLKLAQNITDVQTPLLKKD